MKSKQKSSNHRNGVISLLKFIFSLIIIIYHGKKLSGTGKFKIVPLGYITVDFFFIVSGYYFYKSILKLKEKKNINIYKENILMITNKLKKFLPYILIAGILNIIFFILLQKISPSEVVMSVFNIFLVDMTGLTGYTINGPIWYISSMLIVFFILCPIIYKDHEKYSYYICPIIILFGLGYMYKNYSSLDLYRSAWNKLFYAGTIKSFVEINIGILVYNLSEAFKKKILNKSNKFIITMNILYVAMFLFSIVLILIYKRKGTIDYFILLVITLALILVFIDEKLSKKMDTKFIQYLEKLSLPIFINQRLFLEILCIIGSAYSLHFLLSLILYVTSTIIFSIIELYVMDRIKRRNSNKKCQLIN